MPSTEVAPGGVDITIDPGAISVGRRPRRTWTHRGGRAVGSSAPVPVTDRPLPLLDLIDAALTAVRQRPRPLVTLALVYTVPVALVNGWLSRDNVAGASWLQALAEPTTGGGVLPWADAVLVAHLLNWLSIAFCGVGVSRIVNGWLLGQDRSVSDALRYTARRAWVIGGAFIIIHVVELIGFVLLIVPGLWSVVAFSLVSPIIAAEEGISPVAAIRRSVRLVRRGFGGAAGLVILVGVVGLFIGLAISALPDIGASLIGDSRAWPLLAMSQILSGMLLMPFTAAAMCLLYLDRRFRTEGLDLELRLNAVAGFASQDLGDATASPRRRDLVTGDG